MASNQEKSQNNCSFVLSIHRSFDLGESSCADHVVVRDGINSWSKKIMSVCGGQDVTELVVRSFGSGMRVEFVSDKQISALEFLASYTSHLIASNGNYLCFSVWILLLPPQGFRQEAKSRGGTLVARTYIKDSTYSSNMQSVY